MTTNVYSTNQSLDKPKLLFRNVKSRDAPFKHRSLLLQDNISVFSSPKVKKATFYFQIEPDRNTRLTKYWILNLFFTKTFVFLWSAS